MTTDQQIATITAERDRWKAAYAEAYQRITEFQATLNAHGELCASQANRIAALTTKLEAAEELSQELLSFACGEIGIYDGEDPDSALSCIRGEFAAYSKVMWGIAGILNSGSARPDDVEAAVRQRIAVAQAVICDVDNYRRKCATLEAAVTAEREEVLAVLEPFARVGNAWGTLAFDDAALIPSIAQFKSAAALHARLSAPQPNTSGGPDGE